MEPSRCAMSEGLRRCSKMFGTVRGCSKVFEGIQGCSGVSPDNIEQEKLQVGILHGAAFFGVNEK